VSARCYLICQHSTVLAPAPLAHPKRATRSGGHRRRPHLNQTGRRLSRAVALGLTVRRSYRLLTGGALTVDLGVGRRLQPLGPLVETIAAPQETVFEVIASAYLGRTPRALADKLQVWERGSDMVLAVHHTPVKCGITTTLETVRFQRPDRIDFRLVRGPVPHLTESFQLTPSDAGTELRWQGELGTDLWTLGEWWGSRVARAWNHAVASSLREIAAEAERRAHTSARPGLGGLHG